MKPSTSKFTSNHGITAFCYSTIAGCELSFQDGFMFVCIKSPFPPPPQVLPTQLIPEEKEGKILRVRMIQKEEGQEVQPVYLFDDGATITWIPCGRKLTCSFPGIKFFYGPDEYFGQEVWRGLM